MVTQVIQAGKYRRRVTIQKQIPATDSTGGTEPTWKTVYADIRAEIKSASGREYYLAQQIQSDVVYTISFRGPRTVDASMRILHMVGRCVSEIYNIEAVLPDTTGMKEIVCQCRIRQNAGMRSDGQ